ncbi:MAG: acyl-CoA thioesterase [Burkholderiaceae bacterium]|jgi:acyl-CoA thioesterase YciA|nr:acyl-CoA thioesterase [Burkholderiaceae bacterium]
MPDTSRKPAQTKNPKATTQRSRHPLPFNTQPVQAPAEQLPDDHVLVLRVMPRPSDANVNGDIFGGWVMSWVDMAGAVLPARHAQGRMATVAVNQFIFKQPVRVGDLLSFLAKIERIGHTSITVNVSVYAERLEQQGRYIKVTEATLTYVAIDDHGRPRPVPNRQIGEI